MTNASYSLTQNSQLPTGLKLTDGTISGICTAPEGKYFFTVRAEAEGRTPVELDFIVRVKEYKIEYPAEELPELNVGQSAYFSVATATNEDGLSIDYKLKEGSSLPEGLSLSRYGIVSGTPTRAYTDFGFTVVASADPARPVEKTYKLTVLGLEIADVTYDKVLIGKGYSFRLNAAPNDGGEVSEIRYSLKEGSTLPTGFEMSSDGIITGIGTEIGDQSFTVVVEADGYQTVETTVTIKLYGVFEDGLSSDVDGTPMETPPTNQTSGGCSGAIADVSMVGGLLLTAAVFICVSMINKSKKSK